MRKVIRYGDIIFSSGDVERKIVYKYISKQEQIAHRQILDDENDMLDEDDKREITCYTGRLETEVNDYVNYKSVRDKIGEEE